MSQGFKRDNKSTASTTRTYKDVTYLLSMAQSVIQGNEMITEDRGNNLMPTSYITYSQHGDMKNTDPPSTPLTEACTRAFKAQGDVENTKYTVLHS